ncbi:EcWRKY-17, partial [Eragrostis curvula]
MAGLPDDREGAAREVAKAYERIKTHQPLLFLHHNCCHHGEELSKLAQNLLSEALRALNIALSAMKQQQESSSTTASPLAVKAEPQLSSSSPASPAADSKGATSTSARRIGKRRRSVNEGKNSSWGMSTTVPYEDGYEWRKYGEKRINGSQFTRSYFRCTYKDDTGCLATKQIQQKDNSDPPMFEVTYNNEHTCNCATAAKKNNSSNNLPSQSYCNSGGAIDPPDGVHAMVKQEPRVLPPLVEVSAIPLYEEPFPISNMIYGGASGYNSGIPSAATNIESSCMAGVQSDECSNMDQLTMMEPVGDDALRDLEHFLMHDSFKYN